MKLRAAKLRIIDSRRMGPVLMCSSSSLSLTLSLIVLALDVSDAARARGGSATTIGALLGGPRAASRATAATGGAISRAGVLTVRFEDNGDALLSGAVGCFTETASTRTNVKDMPPYQQMRVLVPPGT